jgi:hypothetical protein
MCVPSISYEICGYVSAQKLLCDMSRATEQGQNNEAAVGASS